MIDKLSSYFCRTLFGFSIILLALAVVDRFIRLFGWTLSWIAYTPSRLLEISASLLIFVIALLLRQIRENLKK